MKDIKYVASQRFSKVNKSFNQSKEQKKNESEKTHKELTKMLQETEKNKKIDFKEKSLMAKEASIKKIVDRSTKEAGGKGGKGPNNNK